MATQGGGDAPEIVSTGEARQGPKGKPVLMVLVASLLLCGVFLFWAMGTTSDRGAASSNPTPGAPVNPVSPAPRQ